MEKRDGAERSTAGFNLFGLDVYLLFFVIVGASFVVFALYYIFFTDLPIPRYCGGRSSGGNVCGYISRTPAARPPGS